MCFVEIFINIKSFDIRAIRDCNLSKFTSYDIQLFNGYEKYGFIFLKTFYGKIRITEDLFPSIICLKNDYSDLIDNLKICAEQFNLQPNDYFISRCIQLYETLLVR